MNKYDRTAQQGTEGIQEGCSEGASLARCSPTPISSASLGNTKELRVPRGRARLKLFPDPGLQTETKIPHKLQCSGASSAEKQNKTNHHLLSNFSASQLGMQGRSWRISTLIPAPDYREAAARCSRHAFNSLTRSEPGRRNNSWFRTSSIFLLVTCTHWIL